MSSTGCWTSRWTWVSVSTSRTGCCSDSSSSAICPSPLSPAALGLRLRHRHEKQADWRKEGRNVLFNDTINTFYLWLYGIWHMVKNQSTAREETWCHHMGYSFWLMSRVLLYAPSHTQNSTYHRLCYTSHRALAGTIYNSIGPPWGIDPMTNHTMSICSTMEPHLAPWLKKRHAYLYYCKYD